MIFDLYFWVPLFPLIPSSFAIW